MIRKHQLYGLNGIIRPHMQYSNHEDIPYTFYFLQTIQSQVCTFTMVFARMLPYIHNFSLVLLLGMKSRPFGTHPALAGKQGEYTS